MSASAREQLKPAPVTDSLRDLRGTIDFLRQEGDLIETDTPVNPDLEITGVQKHLDGSCPLLFNNVVGKPDHRAVTNLFADQGIMCKLFGVNNMTEMTIAIANAIRNPLPPVVVGPVIMVIGLGLAPVAVDMAMYTDSGNQEGYSMLYIFVAAMTLTITICASIFLRGVLSLIPVLIGIVGGYITAILVGIVDFTGIIETGWFVTPDVHLPFVSYDPTWNVGLMIVMLPIVFVTVSEHIGHQMVINKIVGRDFFKKPGLHRSLIGDGVSTMFSSIIGGPPTTTYGENIGVLAITRIFSVWVIGGAGVLAIILGFIGKFTAVVQSIPTPVMGGVSILLFGIIASSGLRMLIDEQVNLDSKRNLVIASVILVIGIGKAHLDFTIGDIPFNLEGMALAAVAGILLNAILPKEAPVRDE